MRAVITGATSGIGKEMAVYLSQLGYDLILTGRSQKHLEQMQKALPTGVEIIALDLSEDRAPFQLYDFCKDKQVDVLVNNAGYGLFGTFDQIDLEDELHMLNVNIRALHILTKLFLRDFKKRNRGRILNVASSAGFLSGSLLRCAAERRLLRGADACRAVYGDLLRHEILRCQPDQRLSPGVARGPQPGVRGLPLPRAGGYQLQQPGRCPV